MNSEKCKNCPAANQDRPCRAQTSGHARYCELIDPQSPAYQPAYIAVLAKGPGEPQEMAARPTVASTLGLIAQMKKCEFWEASSTCGCGKNKCRLGKGQAGIVVHADCFACLATSPLSAPAQP